MTRGTPTGSPATKRDAKAARVNQFRRLMLVALSSGALAGLLLFAVQHFTVVPLIESAEAYETAAHQSTADEAQDHDAWQPADGWQRTSFTALATVLSSVGFAALLFGSLALTGRTVDARRGALWGLAAFACFGLAPALGLPPQPPGVAVADLYARQLWWAGTALATAIGLWLLAGPGRRWPLRIGGVVCLSLPHLIGAPIATGHNAVPAPLIRQFTIASLATTGMFWLVLGTIGGYISSRSEAHRT
jgi:cobalt transporter subunit CbtA